MTRQTPTCLSPSLPCFSPAVLSVVEIVVGILLTSSEASELFVFSGFVALAPKLGYPSAGERLTVVALGTSNTGNCSVRPGCPRFRVSPIDVWREQCGRQQQSFNMMVVLPRKQLQPP